MLHRPPLPNKKAIAGGSAALIVALAIMAGHASAAQQASAPAVKADLAAIKSAYDKGDRTAMDSAVATLKQDLDTAIDKPATSTTAAPTTAAPTTAAPTTMPASTGGTPAAPAGFTKLVMNDDFDSTNSIDLTNSAKSGFNWYTSVPFGFKTTPASDLSVKNSVLTIKPSTDNFNYQLGTVSLDTKAGKAYQYGYFEARMSFNPGDGANSKGWPSFWAMSTDHFNLQQDKRWGELDFFEAYHDAGKASPSQFVGTVHDWNRTPTEDQNISNGGSNIAALSKVDFTRMHTYGCAWTPTSITWYFDGKAVLTKQYTSTGDFGVLNSEKNGETVVLGSGIGYPLNVDWVHIWQ